ncbi:MAG: CHASE4 domain-containing protein [Chloroflexota bacterium]
MSLYTKTLVIIMSILFTLVVMIFFVSQRVLLSNYSQLETQDVQEDMQRTLNLIAGEASQLSVQTGDYAHWDETYGFAQQPNEKYLTDNYFIEAYQSIGINFVAILNLRTEVLFAKAVDLQLSEEMPVSDELQRIVTAPSPLLDLKPDQNGRDGLLMTSKGPMLISAQRILTSQIEGPSAGLLIMGRLLDAAWINHLADSSQLPVKLQPVNDPHLPAALQSALAEITHEHPIVVQPISSTQITGVSVIDDVYGVPAVIVHINFPRTIYEQGRVSLSFLIAVLVIVSLIFTLLMAVLLERLVLARVRQLSRALSDVRATEDMTRRMPIQGSDELTRLAGDINVTLQALTQSQIALKQANGALEERVQERTAELSKANLHLAEEIAQHKQTQVMLLQARDTALEALNLKTRLLENISHDARTPLSVISLRTEMLQAERYGPLTAKQSEVLEGILANAKQLLNFITNFLNEAQLQAKTLKINPIPFEVNAFVKMVEAAILPLAERKSLSFKTKVTSDVPHTLMGDPERLNQILTNLIHNAIKFTDKGSIFVQVFCPDQNHWGLQVTDTGVGISGEAQAHIFDAFWQADGSTARANGQGVGLGLSIVKELTTLMGGEVGVNSQPGQGSSFTVLLPLPQPKEKTTGE